VLLGGTAGLRDAAVRKLRLGVETILWRADGAAAVVRVVAKQRSAAVFAEETPRWHFRSRALGMVTRERERLD